MRRMTTAQVARELGLAAATVQKYARLGRIPFEMTPGGHRRYDVAEVHAALFYEPPDLVAHDLDPDGGLGSGVAITYGGHAGFERAVRSTVMAPAPASSSDVDHPAAIQELFAHARRVLIATPR